MLSLASYYFSSRPWDLQTAQFYFPFQVYSKYLSVLLQSPTYYSPRPENHKSAGCRSAGAVTGYLLYAVLAKYCIDFAVAGFTNRAVPFPFRWCIPFCRLFLPKHNNYHRGCWTCKPHNYIPLSCRLFGAMKSLWYGYHVSFAIISRSTLWHLQTVLMYGCQHESEMLSYFDTGLEIQ